MGTDLAEDARRMRDGLQQRLRSEVRTRKSAETRRRIMATASEIISERGNTVFKMSEVSRRCGMSKGSLYYYFNDKQDLVTAIFKDEMDDLMHVLDTMVQEAPSATVALRRMCDEFVTRISNGGVLAMALVQELALSREEGTYAQNARVRHVVGIIAQQLERAKGEGTVRPDIDSHLAAVAICGVFTFSAVSVSEGRTAETSSADAMADDLYGIVVRGIGAVA